MDAQANASSGELESIRRGGNVSKVPEERELLLLGLPIELWRDILNRVPIYQIDKNLKLMPSLKRTCKLFYQIFYEKSHSLTLGKPDAFTFIPKNSFFYQTFAQSKTPLQNIKICQIKQIKSLDEAVKILLLLTDLTHLYIKNTTLKPETLNLFLPSLPASLKILTLEHAAIEDKGIPYLVDAFQGPLKGLNRLNMSEQKLTSKGWKRLFEGLPLTLEILDIEGQGMDREALKSLATYLRKSELETLYLPDRQFNFEDASILLQALKESKLSTLWMILQQPTTPDMKCLMQTFYRNNFQRRLFNKAKAPACTILNPL